MLPSGSQGNSRRFQLLKDGLTKLVGQIHAKPVLSGPGKGMWIKTENEQAELDLSVPNEELEILSKLCKPGWTIWDCGGHSGYLSVLLSRFVGQDGMVVLFEPERKHFMTVYENANLNGCHNILFMFASVGNPAAKVGFKPPVMARQLSLDEAYQDNEIPIPQLIRLDLTEKNQPVLEHVSRLVNEHRPLFVFNRITDSAWAALQAFARTHSYELLSLQDGKPVATDSVPKGSVLCSFREQVAVG